MTMRSALISGHHKVVATLSTPPWPIRVLGGAIVGYDAYMWVKEAIPTSTLELIKHGILLLVGLSLLYPEAARALMGFARKTIPNLDRRSGGPRVPPVSQ